MHVSFSSLGSNQVAEAEIDLTQVNGTGDQVSPALWIPIRLSASHSNMAEEQGFEYLSLGGRLVFNGAALSQATQVPLRGILHAEFKELKNRHHYLEFPLNSIQVAALEKARNGGDVFLHLEASLEVMQLQALAQAPNTQHKTIVWGQVERHRLTLSNDMIIPRSAWIERVLPKLGFGKIHLIELPAITNTQNEQMSHAYQALRQAQDLHLAGLYADSVGKCRLALEGFFERQPVKDGSGAMRDVPKLKASWETRLGKATYEWLDRSLSALKSESNRPHHVASASYTQFESQMIQMVATALVSYAAKHLHKPPCA